MIDFILIILFFIVLYFVIKLRIQVKQLNEYYKDIKLDNEIIKTKMTQFVRKQYSSDLTYII